jgi:dienelactone hydrolase
MFRSIRCLLSTLLLLAGALPAWGAGKESPLAMTVRPVEWTIDGTTFEGRLVFGDGLHGKVPGLVMVPNWMGVTEESITRAREIAGNRYVVLVADVYGKGVRPADKAQAREQVGKAYADGGTTVRRRVAAAVEALKAQAGTAPLDADRIGALGFCFGGGAVLELARTGAKLSGVASIHGDLGTHLPPSATGIRTPVLVLNGAADTSVSDESIVAFEKEMDALGADWQFVDYGGARHCFSQPEDRPADPKDNCRYDERAARRSMLLLQSFFDEQFGTREG